jgi:phosphinothricin acetyltransferase
MIRDARLDDLPRIVEIYNASIPGRLATADLAPVTVAQRTPWFHAHDAARRPLRVCEEDGVILGWASLQDFYGRCAYSSTAEASIYVAPEAQRRGIARRLLQELIDRAPALGVVDLVAFVFGHNGPSLALMASLGFTPWGRLPGVARLDSVERDLVILGRRVG